MMLENSNRGNTFFGVEVGIPDFSGGVQNLTGLLSSKLPDPLNFSGGVSGGALEEVLMGCSFAIDFPRALRWSGAPTAI